MSYPYDTNPWGDDNYGAQNNNNNNSGQQESVAGTGGYAGYSSSAADSGGYSNPVNQYYYNNNQNQDAYRYDWDDSAAQQQQPLSGQQQQQQQQQQEATQFADTQNSANPNAGQERSAIGRFLSAHIPFCGTVLDTCASINLPFIDALVQHVNRDLLVSKMFYFFFYSAFGSLFPLMGVYFKQLGMNPAQVGILTGVRPFIEIFSAPFWNNLAERFHKGKALLLFSLVSWIIFTYSLAHIRPPASACIAFNDTDYVLFVPYSGDDLSNVDVSQFTDEQQRREAELEAAMASGGSKGSEMLEASARNGSPNKQASEGAKRRRKKREYPTTRTGSSFDELLSGGDNSLLDIDLDDDFDDHLIDGDISSSRSSGSSSSSKSITISAYQKARARSKRGASTKYSDDVLGETDDTSGGESSSSDSESESESERSADQSQPNGRSNDDDSNSTLESGDEEAGANSSEDEDNDVEQAPANKRPNSSPPSNDESIQQSQRERSNPSTGFPTSTTTIANPTNVEVSKSSASEPEADANTNTKTKRIFKHRHKTPPTHIVGKSPIPVDYAVNYNKDKHSQLVTPMFNTVVYKLEDIKSVFFLLLLLICLGEFFSAPALTLADSATLRYLGENTDLYCRQRMFGSFSWAITLLLVGVALDNATSISDHPCGPHLRERSYTVCYIIFSLLMGCALLTATQFRFDYELNENEKSSNGQTILVSQTAGDDKVVTTVASATNVDDLYASTQPRSIFNMAPPINEPPASVQQKSQTGKDLEFLEKWRSAVFAQRTRELPEWVNVFRQFWRNPLHLMYLFITWFLGCGVGLVFTFLFWHLQDVEGTPTLFGICSVINHISEILAYFFSFSFIKRFGHTRVLSVGLACNSARFIYVAFLTNPYYALPFELVQGITHAACFAACCSFMSQKSQPELKTSTQGVMQGIHHGIGRACGALIGGFMINAIGSRASFCLYGLLSGCVLAGFLHIRKKASAGELEEADVKVDDSDALGGYGAPQGVPSAIAGKLSGSQANNTTNHDNVQEMINYQW